MAKNKAYREKIYKIPRKLLGQRDIVPYLQKREGTGKFLMKGDGLLKGNIAVFKNLEIDGGGHRLYVLPKKHDKKALRPLEGGFFLDQMSRADHFTFVLKNMTIQLEDLTIFLQNSENYMRFGNSSILLENVTLDRFQSKKLGENYFNARQANQILDAITLVGFKSLGLKDVLLDQVILQSAPNGDITLNNAEIGSMALEASSIQSDDIDVQDSILTNVSFGEDSRVVSNRMGTMGALTFQDGVQAKIDELQVIKGEPFEMEPYLTGYESFMKPKWHNSTAVLLNLGGDVKVSNLSQTARIVNQKGEKVWTLPYELSWIKQMAGQLSIQKWSNKVPLLKSQILGGNLVLQDVKAGKDRLFVDPKASISVLHTKIKQVDADGRELKDQNLDALQKLDRMIGLDSVKKKIKSFISSAELNLQRQANGLVDLSEKSADSLHMVFGGSAGVGKTVTARLVAQALFEKGVLPSNKFVEASPREMMGEYKGQTRPKTAALAQKALGGVLFIDEAYGLNDGGSGFGSEAVDELLKWMENHRDNLIVIMAGYERPMQKLLQINEGLASRFTNWIEFPNYSLNELTQIGMSMLKSNGSKYQDPKFMFDGLKKLWEVQEPEHIDVNGDLIPRRSIADGNGRMVRNLVQFAQNARDQRLMDSNQGDFSNQELVTVTEGDMVNGFNQLYKTLMKAKGLDDQIVELFIKS